MLKQCVNLADNKAVEAKGSRRKPACGVVMDFFWKQSAAHCCEIG